MKVDQQPTDLVTIIIPAYNAKDHIEKSIISAIRQSYPYIELIIVNDGSSDGTEQVCAKYLDHPHVLLLNQQNRGVSAARNLGLKHSHGKYITFLDSDDTLPFNAIELMYKTAIISNTGLVLGNISNKNENTYMKSSVKMPYRLESGLEIITDLLYQKKYKNAVFAKLYHSQTLKKASFDNKVKYGEDLLFNFSVLLKCSRIAIIPNVVYFYSPGHNSAMNRPYSSDRLDAVKVAQSIMSKTRNMDQKLRNAAVFKCFAEALSLVYKIPKIDKQFDKDLTYLVTIIKQHSKTVLRDNNVQPKFRLYSALAIINLPMLIRMLKQKQVLKSWVGK